MTIELAPYGSELYSETVELRRRVLRLPLGLDFSEDDMAKEINDFHIAGLIGSQLVSCLVLTPLDTLSIKMRQVAVAPSHQGQGLGRSLVEFSENFARAHDFKTMVLNAREPVVRFYEKLGYSINGEPFVEVTIPHRQMAKAL